MKTQRKSKLAIALAFASIPILSGCGASNSAPAPIAAPIVPGIGIPGGCVPISQAIGFTGTNVYLDGANINAGAIPGGQTFGALTLGAGAAITSGFTYARQGVDGSIGFNATNVPTMPGAFPNGTGNGASITGTLTISSATQQDIQFKFGGMGGNYNPNTPNTAQPGMNGQVCVSGMAIQSLITTSGTTRTLYNGNVYLYLNGTQHGYVLYF